MNPVAAIIHLGTWGQHHGRAVGGGLVAMTALAGLAALVRHRRQDASQVMGSARWATPREIQAATLMARHGVVIGRVGSQVLCDDSETHVLLCGPTRSGK